MFFSLLLWLLTWSDAKSVCCKHSADNREIARVAEQRSAVCSWHRDECLRMAKTASLMSEVWRLVDVMLPNAFYRPSLEVVRWRWQTAVDNMDAIYDLWGGDL